jgi:hypothetical protein
MEVKASTDLHSFLAGVQRSDLDNNGRAEHVLMRELLQANYFGEDGGIYI